MLCNCTYYISKQNIHVLDTENNEGIGYPTAGLPYKIHPFSHSVKHGYSKPLGPAKNSSLYQT